MQPGKRGEGKNPLRVNQLAKRVALRLGHSCQKAVGLEECSNEIGFGGLKSIASDV